MENKHPEYLGWFGIIKFSDIDVSSLNISNLDVIHVPSRFDMSGWTLDNVRNK